MNPLIDFVLAHGGVSIWRGLYPPDARRITTLAISFTWHDAGIWKRDDCIVEEDVAAHAEGNYSFVSQQDMLGEIKSYLDTIDREISESRETDMNEIGVKTGDLWGMRIVHDGQWHDVTDIVQQLIYRS